MNRRNFLTGLALLPGFAIVSGCFGSSIEDVLNPDSMFEIHLSELRARSLEAASKDKLRDKFRITNAMYDELFNLRKKHGLVRVILTEKDRSKIYPSKFTIPTGISYIADEVVFRSDTGAEKIIKSRIRLID